MKINGYIWALIGVISATLTTNVIAKSNLVDGQPRVGVQVYTQDTYQANEAIKMFPLPTVKQKMYVLTVPKLDAEQNYKIEIGAGKTQLVDCNRHFLISQIKPQTLSGWGYSYYHLEDVSKFASTRMGCLGAELKPQFITQTRPLMVTYNSRLPIVVYVPQSAQLRYRIWRADDYYRYY